MSMFLERLKPRCKMLDVGLQDERDAFHDEFYSSSYGHIELEKILYAWLLDKRGAGKPSLESWIWKMARHFAALTKENFYKKNQIKMKFLNEWIVCVQTRQNLKQFMLQGVCRNKGGATMTSEHLFLQKRLENWRHKDWI